MWVKILVLLIIVQTLPILTLSQIGSYPKLIEIESRKYVIWTLEQDKENSISIEKGIGYYKNYQVCQRQGIVKDSTISYWAQKFIALDENYKSRGESIKDLDILLTTCEDSRNTLQDKFLKANKKVKLIPYIGVGGVVLGTFLGLQAR